MKSSWIIKSTIVMTSFSLLVGCGNNKQAANQADFMANNIVGGKNANAAYQRETGTVALLIRKATGTGICTGSLIARQLVLTAAHCLQGEVLNVVAVFATDISKAKVENLTAAIVAAPHEDFIQAVITRQETWNDIALLKLASDAPAQIKLAKLPASAAEVELKAGVKLSQAGYGRAEANRDAVSDTSGILRRVDGIEILSLSTDSKELLLKEDGKGSCNGDSGGPAFLKTRKGLVLVGVNSRGTSPTSCIEKGIYTNVLAHLDWIKTTSERLLAAEVLPNAANDNSPEAPSAGAPAANAPPLNP